MSRLALLLALAVAAGCSSPQKKVPRLGEETETETEAEVVDKSPMAEAEGCMVELGPQMSNEEERQYIMATESSIVKAREEFRAFCGSAIPVMHNWSSFWESAGYDNREAPGAIGDATIALMDATRPYCEGENGKKFREGVRQVVVTATDTPERIGLCFDDKTKTMVVRMMLEPGSTEISSWDGEQLVEWYDANL